MIAGVPQNQSPVSEASQNQFGDALPHKARDGARTLSLLQDLVKTVDPRNLQKIRERRENRTIEWRPYAILVGLGVR